MSRHILLGAVLAGGASRRFGRDKAAEPVAGVPMIERAVRALRGSCAEVVVISSRDDTPTGGWTVLPDLREDTGPLAGLEAALAHAEEVGADAVFVIACDLPLVEAQTIATIKDVFTELRLSARTPSASPPAPTAVAPARSGDPDFEPLCAVYDTSCLAEVRHLLDNGERAARALFEAVDGTRVALHGDGHHTGVGRNVNTPEDLIDVEETLGH